jgi:LPXTG-motif cell wall-anchored protein
MSEFNFDSSSGPAIQPPKSPSTDNRTFLIAAGILAAVAVFALVCIAIIALIWLPQKRARDLAMLATVNAQNTEVALYIQQTQQAIALAAAATRTPTPNLNPPTLTPTRTPVVVVLAPTKPPTQDIHQETLAALLTQAARVTQTVVIPATFTATPAGLPDTGFADDVGLPAMLGIALLLLVVIIAARRLRTT